VRRSLPSTGLAQPGVVLLLKGDDDLLQFILAMTGHAVY
jgi:hypothetical protein